MLNQHANTSELKISLQQYNVPYPWKTPCCHQNVEEDPVIHVSLTGCNIDKSKNGGGTSRRDMEKPEPQSQQMWHDKDSFRQIRHKVASSHKSPTIMIFLTAKCY